MDSLVQVKEFKDHAFADPVDNLTATDPSLALAATQGKALKQLVDQLNSALEDNFNSNGTSLTNSTYYPTSYIYRSGQDVYLRCAGITLKEVPADTEVTITLTIPEKYRPNVDLVFYPNITIGGKTLRVAITKDGKITFTSPEKLEAGFAINMHITYMTGKSNF